MVDSCGHKETGGFLPALLGQLGCAVAWRAVLRDRLGREVIGRSELFPLPCENILTHRIVNARRWAENNDRTVQRQLHEASQKKAGVEIEGKYLLHGGVNREGSEMAWLQ